MNPTLLILAIRQAFPFVTSAPLPVFHLYGATADSGKTYDPLLDATAYSLTTTYALGDMVVSGGTYYISDDYGNLGNAVTNTTWWYVVNQIMYFDATSGSDSTRVPSTNATTAKAAPFKGIEQISARSTSTSGYTQLANQSGTLCLLKRGDTYNGVIANLSKQCYVACWGPSGSALPIVNFRNNMLASPGYGHLAAAFGSRSTTGGLRIAGVTLDGNSKQLLVFASGSAASFNVGDTLTGQTTGATCVVTWNPGDGISVDVSTFVGIIGGVGGVSEVVSNGTYTATTVSGATAINVGVDGIWSYVSNQRVFNCVIQNFSGNGQTLGYSVTPTGAADNTLVYNNVFQNNCQAGSGGGLFGGSLACSIRLLQNTFKDNGSTGDIRSHNMYLNDTTNNGSGKSMEVSYNYSYMTANNGNLGLVVHGTCSNWLIHHNDFSACNNGVAICDGYPTAGEFFDIFQVYSNLIRNCGMYSGQSGQSWILSCLTNSVISGNIISNCTNVGTVSDYTGQDVTATSTNNLLMAQNTYVNTPGYRVRGYPTHPNSGAWVGAVKFQNEIFYSTSASSEAFELGNNVGGTITLTNNDYYTPNNATPVRYLSTAAGSGGTQMSFATLYSTSGGAQGANCITGDPLFTNLGSGIYTLQSGSPAKGTGATGLGITTDFAGNTFTTPPNMGAYA